MRERHSLKRSNSFIAAALVGAAIGVLCTGMFGLGCNKPPEPEPSAKPAPMGPSTSGAAKNGEQAGSKPSQAGPSDIGWDAPAAWQKVENPSPMRKATYKIPKASGDAEDAELSISQAGGSVEMNVQRWAGQFGAKGDAVKRTPRTVNGLNVTIVEIHGSFAGGMPGGPAGEPKPGYALLGAIVETGPASGWFFKATGPDKTIEAAKADFDKMVDSFRAK